MWRKKEIYIYLDLIGGELAFSSLTCVVVDIAETGKAVLEVLDLLAGLAHPGVGELFVEQGLFRWGERDDVYWIKKLGSGGMQSLDGCARCNIFQFA